MSAKLSENQHRGYLETFLDAAKDLKELGESVTIIAPYAKDSLNIAKDVGYTNLYDEFNPLYREAGLIQ
jgi:hypothetical protein